MRAKKYQGMPWYSLLTKSIVLKNLNADLIKTMNHVLWFTPDSRKPRFSAVCHQYYQGMPWY